MVVAVVVVAVVVVVVASRNFLKKLKVICGFNFCVNANGPPTEAGCLRWNKKYAKSLVTLEILTFY